MSNPTFCICENNCEADLHLCFRYIDSTIPLQSVPFHLFGDGGGALAIGKKYARNAQIGKNCGIKFFQGDTSVVVLFVLCIGFKIFVLLAP